MPDINKAKKWVDEIISGAKESAKNYKAAIKGNIKTSGVLGIGGMKNKLVDKMMEKYPSGTVIGDAHFARRRAEVYKMVKAGNMKGARDFITAKKKEFDMLN